jgi:hypothetical protein
MFFHMSVLSQHNVVHGHCDHYCPEHCGETEETDDHSLHITQIGLIIQATEQHSCRKEKVGDGQVKDQSKREHTAETLEREVDDNHEQ